MKSAGRCNHQPALLDIDRERPIHSAFRNSPSLDIKLLLRKPADDHNIPRYCERTCSTKLYKPSRPSESHRTLLPYSLFIGY